MPDGSFSSAEAAFDVNYAGFPEGTNFTGLHIHTGAAGSEWPGDDQLGAAGPGGRGGQRGREPPLQRGSEHGDCGVGRGLYGLFARPSAYYMNLHTTVNPAGAIRGQMRNTDKSTFQVTMLPGNEVPPVVGLDARAHAEFTLHTLRNNEGHVLAGMTIFDVNYRFPGETQFTGLHIHDNWPA
jgi:hypothetical protein